MPSIRFDASAFIAAAGKVAKACGEHAKSWLDSEDGKKLQKKVSELFVAFAVKKVDDFLKTDWVEKYASFRDAIRRFREDPRNKYHWFVRIMNGHDFRARMKTDRDRRKWERRESKARRAEQEREYYQEQVRQSKLATAYFAEAA